MNRSEVPYTSGVFMVGGVLAIAMGAVLWDRAGYVAGLGFVMLATGIFLSHECRAKSGKATSWALVFAGILALVLGLAAMLAKVAGL